MSVHFVYLLLDPLETGAELFYIGQGQGSRPADHVAEAKSWDKLGRPMPAATGTKTPDEIRAKLLKVLEILDAGRTPRIEFLRTGLRKDEADLVETTAIELIGLDNLCNQVMGPAGAGRVHATAHEILLDATTIELTEPSVVVPVQGRWGGSLDYAGLIGQAEEEIWANARRRWRLSKARRDALLTASPPRLLVALQSGGGFPAGRGLVVGMWEISGVKEDQTEPGGEVRWAFTRPEGVSSRLAKLRATYLGHRIQIKAQAGVQYIG